MAVLEKAFSLQRYLTTNAPDTTEITLLTPAGEWNHGDTWLLQFVNASGHSGTAYFAPLPIEGIRVGMTTEKGPRNVKLMSTGDDLDFTWATGKLEFTVPRLKLLEGVIIDW